MTWDDDEDEPTCVCPHFHEGPGELHRRADLIACEAVGHVPVGFSGGPRPKRSDLGLADLFSLCTPDPIAPFSYVTCSRCGALVSGEPPRYAHASSQAFRDLIDEGERHQRIAHHFASITE